MLKGILFALSACLIWGLIFVIPEFMSGFSPIEIALGRYFFYGIVSLFILLKMSLSGLYAYPLAIWKKAFHYSLVITIFYYTCVVLAVQHASPAMCALTLGISPITIAFYGNWQKKECSFRILILPSILILAGLIVINAPKLTSSESPDSYLFGVACAFLALLAWSWYVVANSRFLKENPQVATHHWSTLIGASTLCWTIFFSSVVWVFFDQSLELDKHFTFGSQLTAFFMGCAVLGLLCSWVGAFLWNTASVHLPVPLAGQLTIFETIFGIVFVYALGGAMPPQQECLGIALLLAAIVYGIRTTLQEAPQHAIA